MTRSWLVAALLAIPLALSGCGGSDEPDWSEYSPLRRDRIEAQISSGDCVGLSHELYAADGTGDVVLGSFLLDAMQDAGCA